MTWVSVGIAAAGLVTNLVSSGKGGGQVQQGSPAHVSITGPQTSPTGGGTIGIPVSGGGAVAPGAGGQQSMEAIMGAASTLGSIYAANPEKFNQMFAGKGPGATTSAARVHGGGAPITPNFPF